MCTFYPPIYTHDGARAKFGTNSHKTDNSVRYSRGFSINSFGGFYATKNTFLRGVVEGRRGESGVV